LELLDFLVTPVLLTFLLGAVFLYSRKVPQDIRKFFVPGFLLKVLGGFGLAFIYTYYYGRGDTFGYFHSAEVLNSAFFNSLEEWLNLMFNDSRDPSLLYYTSRMGRYAAGPEFFMIRVTAFFGLFSFNSYMGTTLLFATFSFAGSWCMYRVLVRRYPDLKKTMAIAVFLIPSVVFWGSGLMKDTIVLGSIGFILYGIELLMRKRWRRGLVYLLPALWLMLSIREFMLPALVLPVVAVIYLKYTLLIRHWILRMLATVSGLVAALGAFILFSSHFAARLKDFAEEAQISANYLYRVSILNDGSAYKLGRLDGSIESVMNLAPAAVWVSLFRPYVWESNNVVMLLTALESLALLVGFVMVLFKTRITGMFKLIARDSFLQYALVFTVFFAFVVGITTFNFGSLARYRIPFLPFFTASLFIIWYRTGKYARK